MKTGALIEYYSIDDENVYGIVTKYFDHYDHGGLHRPGPAVEVCWMDGDGYTIESVWNLHSPNMQYINVVSEIKNK